MIAAAGVLAASWTRGRLVVAAVVDEEYLSIGAEALVREWRADVAIVTEPTDLQLAVGHKGFAWVEIVAHGRAAHGSRPGRRARRHRAHGPRARARSKRAIASCAPARRWPFQGTGSLHASIITGGRELSSYPGSLHAADGAPHGLRRGRSRGDAEIDALLARLARPIRSSTADGPPDGLSARRTRSIPSHRLPQAMSRRSATRAVGRARPACRSGPTPPFSQTPASRPCCSVPAAPASTARSSTSTSTMSYLAGTC